MDGWIYNNRWMVEWIEEENEKNRWTEKINRRMHRKKSMDRKEWMAGWTGGKDGWLGRGKYGWLDG